MSKSQYPIFNKIPKAKNKKFGNWKLGIGNSTQWCAIINNNCGSALITALVFLGIFLTLTTALLSYVQLEVRVSTRSLADSQAIATAEAGIEYYRWHLAHAPDDFMDGTGTPGTYTHTYRDPQGGIVGTYALEVTPRNTCNGSVRILSHGTSAEDPKRTRTVAITYGSPALTKYSFLTKSNIWFGGGEIKGPIHSNGGIRMDSDNKSRMTSSKATYICGAEHGCNPARSKPGIWGSGAGGSKGLWDFPADDVNFETIALNLRTLQQQAIAANTDFGASGAYGYHAVLQTNGTVLVSRVTDIYPKVWGYDGRTGWVETAEKIKSEVAVRTLTIPEASVCSTASLLFFEDTLWVDGATKQPVTLVAGRFPVDTGDASIIVNGNLTVPASGSAGKIGSIGLIAQKDVLIPLESLNTLEIHAALFAQKGHVFRNYYCSDERLNRLYGYKCKSSYNAFVTRSSLTLKGTVITNQIAAWTWVDQYGNVISGYRGGDNTYETRLIFAPPPFFPRQGGERIITWEEINQ